MTRYLSSLSAFLILISLLAAGPASGAVKPKLIIGGDHNNPPYEFVENGKPTGFNIELIREVAEIMGFDVEIRLGPWSKVRQDLEQGKIDALAGMYYSAERSRLIDFSLPHTMVSSAIFVRKGSPIHSFEDIRDKSVIVQEHDVLHDFLIRNRLASRIVAVMDPDEQLRLLASGKHDCALMTSRLQGEYFAKKLKLTKIRVIDTNLPQLRYCFAVSKGNRGLVYRLDEGLNILRVNGKYQEIYEKWFGVYEKRDLWGSLKYFVLALVLIVVLLIASLAWSRSLRREVRIRTAELRDSEEKFRVLAETSPAGICLYQGERFIHVNAAAVRLLGFTEQECLEMSFWDWAHDDFKDLVKERGLARQRGEPVPSQYECMHVTKSGEERWTFVSAGAIEYKGKPAGIVTLFDITDSKRMRDELQRAHDKLERRVEERTAELETLNITLEKRVREEVTKNREKDIILIQQNRQAALGELLDHIAHQWKQPLSSLFLIIQDLGETWSCGELNSEYITETVGKTTALLEHMTHTIGVFRDFYRPDKEKKVFSIKDSINQTLAFIVPALRFHAVAVELDTDSDLLAIGYPKEYAQVLLNILSNAGNAFKERKVDKPALKIEAFRENSKAVVTITDNAGGIPEAILGKIFDLFFTTNESRGGTGIGLYMSKNIIEKNMGGTLRAANVGGGAQFRIELNVPES